MTLLVFTKSILVICLSNTQTGENLTMPNRGHTARKTALASQTWLLTMVSRLVCRLMLSCCKNVTLFSEVVRAIQTFDSVNILTSCSVNSCHGSVLKTQEEIFCVPKTMQSLSLMLDNVNAAILLTVAWIPSVMVTSKFIASKRRVHPIRPHSG